MKIGLCKYDKDKCIGKHKIFFHRETKPSYICGFTERDCDYKTLYNLAKLKTKKSKIEKFP